MKTHEFRYLGFTLNNYLSHQQPNEPNVIYTVQISIVYVVNDIIIIVIAHIGIYPSS